MEHTNIKLIQAVVASTEVGGGSLLFHLEGVAFFAYDKDTTTLNATAVSAAPSLTATCDPRVIDFISYELGVPTFFLVKQGRHGYSILSPGTTEKELFQVKEKFQEFREQILNRQPSAYLFGKISRQLDYLRKIVDRFAFLPYEVSYNQMVEEVQKLTEELQSIASAEPDLVTAKEARSDVDDLRDALLNSDTDRQGLKQYYFDNDGMNNPVYCVITGLQSEDQQSRTATDRVTLQNVKVFTYDRNKSLSASEEVDHIDHLNLFANEKTCEFVRKEGSNPVLLGKVIYYRRGGQGSDFDFGVEVKKFGPMKGWLKKYTKTLNTIERIMDEGTTAGTGDHVRTIKSLDKIFATPEFIRPDTREITVNEGMVQYQELTARRDELFARREQMLNTAPDEFLHTLTMEAIDQLK